MKARNYEEAFQAMKGVPGDWYFCRGYFLQATNSFKPYTTAELAAPESLAPPAPAPQPTSPPANVPVATAATEPAAPAVVSSPVAAHSDDSHRQFSRPPPAKRKATGRVCQECGATSTPQWREGPTGPKTLCNACGVRFVRAQQRAQKRPAAGKAAAASLSGSPKLQASPKAQAPVAPKAKVKHEVLPEVMLKSHEQSSRPIRQAALAAASRTAVFARTGEFPDDPDVPPTTLHRRSGKSAGASHDSSHVSTDSADEVLYDSKTSGRALDIRPGMSLHRQDAAAAVNLLALSTVASGELEHHGKGSPRHSMQHTHAAGGRPPTSGTVSSTVATGNAPSQIPGIKASDIASVMSLNMPVTLSVHASLPAAASVPSSCQPAVQSTGDTASGSPAKLAHFDPTLFVPPVLTKLPGGSPNVRAAAVAPSTHPSNLPPQPLPGPLNHVQSPCSPSKLQPCNPGSIASTEAKDATASTDQSGPGSKTTNEFYTMAMRALRYHPDLATYADVFADYDQVQGQLPEDVVHRLAEVKERVEAASREAAAAEAAVQAVSQVFAVRQDAASRARTIAAEAGHKLKEYLSTLIGLYPDSQHDPQAQVTEAGPAHDVPEQQRQQQGLVQAAVQAMDILQANADMRSAASHLGVHTCSPVRIVVESVQSPACLQGDVGMTGIESLACTDNCSSGIGNPG
eukprot:CAMPEP_0202908362 /NCGR_PEP_ID=MMETSP1392-20130828/45777_1 /ASSEMBLY_ACC=CAM_ASM_000868 /TAXON_ID=225041 /ORGANISM="Chlamydomonas chlamydogama, Strain SAG 11-48b" /LENGTH=684 /DNA_ID=CAMNT_0049597649 /DNA_START=488 /DNA_END=2542 /DNA_ORIENTATION=+